jgi:hypothetical protein
MPTHGNTPCNAVLPCSRRMIIGLSRSFSVPGEVRRATEVAFRLVGVDGPPSSLRWWMLGSADF